jgi:hypothetical protein
MRVDIVWENGGLAELRSMNDSWLVVLATTPRAPGTPWKGKLQSDERLPVGLKVKTCKKQPDGHFLIEGPSFNLTKEARDALLALVQPATTTAAPAGPPDAPAEPPTS